MIPHALPILPPDSKSMAPPQRSDGRRSVDLEHSPALNKASKLYGKPDWWGEVGPGQEAEARQREFEIAKPGSQILRTLDPEVRRESAPKLSIKDELRLQSISSSDPATSWVIDFGGGGGGGTLPRMRRARDHSSRPRSADPSPNRLTSRRDLSPVPKRAITPTSIRHSSFSIPRTAPIAQRQRATTPPIIRCTDAASKKPPCGDKVSSPKRKAQKKPTPLTTPPGTPQHSKPPSPKHSKPHSPRNSKPSQTRKTQSKKSNSSANSSEIPPAEPRSPPRSRTISPPDCAATLPNVPHITTEVNSANDFSETTSIDLKHLNAGGRMSHLVRDEETYTVLPISSDEGNSLSSLSDHTLSPPSEKPAVVSSSGGDGERGAEGQEREGPIARKQWTKEDSQVRQY